MMLLRANALAKGLSGVRPRVVETLCQMLNAKLNPVILRRVRWALPATSRHWPIWRR